MFAVRSFSPSAMLILSAKLSAICWSALRASLCKTRVSVLRDRLPAICSFQIMLLTRDVTVESESSKVEARYESEIVE